MMELLVVEGGITLTVMTMAGFVAAKLRLSLLPLLVAMGIAIGPHLPSIGMIDWRFAHSADLLAFIGRLGLVGLVFALGLECAVGRRHRVRRPMVLGSTISIAVQCSVGLAYASLGRWPWPAVLVVAGIMAMASRAMVAYMVAHVRRTDHPEIALIQGMHTCEAMVNAIVLAGVAVVLGSGAPHGQGVMPSAAVILGGVLAGFFLCQPAVRWLDRALQVPADATLVLVLFAGWCVVAGRAETLQMVDVVGVLLGGLLLAATVHRQRIVRLIRPLRDVLAAFFYFSFGLTIDPSTLPGTVGLVLGAVGCTLAGALLAGRLAGRAARLSSRASYTMGLMLIARGECALILASLGEVAGLVPVLQPFTAMYVLVLALLGPLLATASSRLVAVVQGRQW
jgi:CPA2 family monovalent cation:H+ antiporter-2